MGQKVNPIGIRLGITKDWLSRWYVGSKDFASTIYADYQVRKFLNERLKHATVSRIEIERAARNVKVVIYSARPGVIIGKSGKDVEKLRNALMKILDVPVQLVIEEVRKPALDAKLVAEGVSFQLLRRTSFRRAMKQAVGNAVRAGAKGIKICVSGRLGGAEIARTEWAKYGRVPLHTFRADIDYGTSEAKTTYGIIGIKVWVFKGEVLDRRKKGSNEKIEKEKIK